MKALSREDAIDATALSLTRRDGPDVFQRLELEKEATPGIVRWTRVGRRDQTAASRSIDMPSAFFRV